MCHSKTEKANTHKRIVTIAAKKFREQALAGIGIADLMKEASLTVGGFYNTSNRVTCWLPKRSARRWKCGKIGSMRPPLAGRACVAADRTVPAVTSATKNAAGSLSTIALATSDTSAFGTAVKSKPFMICFVRLAVGPDSYSFENLRDEAVDIIANRSDQHQYVSALIAFYNGTLNGVDLCPESLDAGQQFLLFLRDLR